MSRKKITISKLNLEKIGGRIAYIRVANGMNQEEFCNVTGLTKGNLSCLENHKYEPSYQAIIKILEKFDINSDWLLFGNNELTDPPKAISSFHCLDPDPSVNDLLIKTREVLASQTSYADSLKANVNSFHESIKSREEINSIRSEIDELKKHIVNRREGERQDPIDQDQALESHQEHRTGTSSGREESRGK